MFQLNFFCILNSISHLIHQNAFLLGHDFYLFSGEEAKAYKLSNFLRIKYLLGSELKLFDSGRILVGYFGVKIHT